jgi:hypothetical protein
MLKRIITSFLFNLTSKKMRNEFNNNEIETIEIIQKKKENINKNNS